MPIWVAVLPAPVSDGAHCAWSGLPPLAVLMLPFAAKGSTRLPSSTAV